MNGQHPHTFVLILCCCFSTVKHSGPQYFTFTQPSNLELLGWHLLCATHKSAEAGCLQERTKHLSFPKELKILLQVAPPPGHTLQPHLGTHVASEFPSFPNILEDTPSSSVSAGDLNWTLCSFRCHSWLFSFTVPSFLGTQTLCDQASAASRLRPTPLLHLARHLPAPADLLQVPESVMLCRLHALVQYGSLPQAPFLPFSSHPIFQATFFSAFRTHHPSPPLRISLWLSAGAAAPPHAPGFMLGST